MLKYFISIFLLCCPVVAPTIVLKRIQTGTANIASLATVTAPISAVDTTKSFVLAYNYPNLTSPRDALFTVQLTNSTLVTFARGRNTSATANSIRYYVLEFLSGVTVQRGQGTVDAVPRNRPISTVGAMSNAFLLSSFRNNSNNSFSSDDFFSATLTSTTNVRGTVQGSSATGIFEYQVVQSPDVNVQRGAVSFASSDLSKTATVSAFDVDKTWLHYDCTSTSGTTADIGQKGVTGKVTNSTTLTFFRSRPGTTMYCDYQAIEFTDKTRVQTGSVGFATGATTGTISLAVPVILGATIPAAGWRNACGNTSYAANDVIGSMCVDMSFSNQTTLNAVRSQTSNPASIQWQTISFPKRKIIQSE